MSVYLGTNRVGSNKLSMSGVYGQLYSLSSALSLTTTAQKVPFDVFEGYGCSKSSNGIKVTEAGVYIISGSAYFSTGFTANDLVHAEIWVNSTVISDGVMRVGATSYYSTLNVTPFAYTLSANDVVYLYVLNQAAARGTVDNRRHNGLTLFKIS